MAVDDAWLRAEMGGTTRASVISKPEVVVALIKRAKRPLLIIGHMTKPCGKECEVLSEFIREITHSIQISLVVTSHTAKNLKSRGIPVTTVMGGMEIVDRLRDPSWKGFDESGQYDLILIAGIPYSLCWVLLSGIRTGAPSLRTIVLDRRYQPNASFSFPNLTIDNWQNQLQTILTTLEK